jgi:hypothetical protein
VLQLHCGPRPTDLQVLKHGVSMASPPEGNHLSAATHHAGVLLIRLLKDTATKSADEPPYSLLYGLQVSRPGQEGGAGYSGVPKGLPRCDVMDTMATSRYDMPQLTAHRCVQLIQFSLSPPLSTGPGGHLYPWGPSAIRCLRHAPLWRITA